MSCPSGLHGHPASRPLQQQARGWPRPHLGEHGRLTSRTAGASEELVGLTGMTVTASQQDVCLHPTRHSHRSAREQPEGGLLDRKSNHVTCHVASEPCCTGSNMLVPGRGPFASLAARDQNPSGQQDLGRIQQRSIWKGLPPGDRERQEVSFTSELIPAPRVPIQSATAAAAPTASRAPWASRGAAPAGCSRTASPCAARTTTCYHVISLSACLPPRLEHECVRPDLRLLSATSPGLEDRTGRRTRAAVLALLAFLQGGNRRPGAPRRGPWTLRGSPGVRGYLGKTLQTLLWDQTAISPSGEFLLRAQSCH